MKKKKKQMIHLFISGLNLRSAKVIHVIVSYTNYIIAMVFYLFCQ